MVAVKRRLSDQSKKRQPNDKRMRVISARIDSGLHGSRARFNKTSSEIPSGNDPVRTGVRDDKTVNRSSASGCQPAPTSSRLLKRPRQDDKLLNQPAKRALISKNSSTNEDQSKAALLQQRKLARQLKWSQRALGGRKVSSACLGASSSSAALGDSCGAAAANTTGGQKRPVFSPRTARGRAAPISGTGRCSIMAHARRRSGRKEDDSNAGSVSVKSPAAGDGAAKPGRPAGVASVRLNRAALQRLQMRNSTATVATSGRRHTLLGSSALSRTPLKAKSSAVSARRQTTVGAVNRTANCPLKVPKTHAPESTTTMVSKKRAENPRLMTSSRPSAVSGSASGVNGGSMRRSLSAMHRAKQRRTLPVSGSATALNRRSNASKTPPKNGALSTIKTHSAAKRVRRRSFSIDEEVVAATPHIRRPVISSHSSVKKRSDIDGPSTPSLSSTANTAARLTPVGFDTSPTAFPLQLRLKKWLAKRGKSLSSFRHLQCFHGNSSVNKRSLSVYKRSAREQGKRQRISTDCVMTSLSKPQQQCPAIEEEQQLDPVEEDCSDSNSNEIAGDHKETADLAQAVDELRQLQTQGLPVEQLEGWLLQLSRVPGALRLAGYWLCHAAAAEKRGRLDQLLDSFKQASAASAEPVCELVDGLESLVRRATDTASANSTADTASADQENIAPQNVVVTPARAFRTPRKPLLDSANIFRSSAVKYALYDRGQAVIKRLASMKHAVDTAGDNISATEANMTQSMIITPVRRSTRRCVTNVTAASPLVKSVSRVAKSSNAHLAIFDSLDAISDVLRESALFTRNSALKITP